MSEHPVSERAAPIDTDAEPPGPVQLAEDPAALPVARVAVDVPLAHLDRPFDYAVPPAMADVALPGTRVRVRFAGRQVPGWVLSRADVSSHQGRLAPLAAAVSAEPVLAPEVLALARAVADRWGGSLVDVLRLAVPPRHARVEREEPSAPAGPVPRPEVGEWARYPAGRAMLDGLAADAAPRAVWGALPGAGWPAALATAVGTTLAAGRGAIVVVPDARDLARVDAALTALLGPGRHVALSADLGPAERYRRFLALRRGIVRAVVGTRAAAYAPVSDLGLVAIWDDGDDLHVEPRAPYAHARDVLVLRAHLAGAAALLGGFSRTAEAEQLLVSGWARPVVATRETLRATAPRVRAAGDDAELARDPAARSARLPTLAWRTAAQALAEEAPVLVQVPRRGYVPALACAQCRSPARCEHCAGPLGSDGADGRHRADGGTIARHTSAPLRSPHPGSLGADGPADAVPACRWCGRPAAAWRCQVCGGRGLRASIVGARRTAEELGRAFPGVTVRTSGAGEVLAGVPAGPSLVIATPGAEPVADGGYGAVLLLDGWALLTRADLRAGEETLRRWLAAAALARSAPDGGRVVVLADGGLAPVQALVRWDPPGFAARELAERAELGFPPAVRMAAVTGVPAAVADLLERTDLPADAELLGPVPGRTEDEERMLVRVPRAAGAALAGALKTAAAQRSAGKAEPVQVRLDPLDPV